jgi:hypothetical protein
LVLRFKSGVCRNIKFHISQLQFHWCVLQLYVFISHHRLWTQNRFLIPLYIITYRYIAKWQLCKQRTVRQPLLGNSSVDILFPRQRENTQ